MEEDLRLLPFLTSVTTTAHDSNLKNHKLLLRIFIYSFRLDNFMTNATLKR